MFAGPFALIGVAIAAARAGLVSRWVIAAAVFFFVADMLPIPAAEELQGLIGIVTFAVVAAGMTGRTAPRISRTRVAATADA
jgi:hypothetical protein